MLLPKAVTGVMAVFIKVVQVVSNSQNLRTSEGRISAFALTHSIPASRMRCRSRAASTRSRTVLDGSPCRLSLASHSPRAAPDVDIDAVEQRAGDALLVFGDGRGGAGAGLSGSP